MIFTLAMIRQLTNTRFTRTRIGRRGIKKSARARRGAASSSWCSRVRTRPLILNGTLPWGWICVCRPCWCDSSSCGAPRVSSDGAVGATPCFHDRGCRPHSRCSSDDPRRRCCSSGPPPADFYATHAHRSSCTPFSAYTRPWPPLYAHTSAMDTHTRSARATANRSLSPLPSLPLRLYPRFTP